MRKIVYIFFVFLLPLVFLLGRSTSQQLRAAKIVLVPTTMPQKKVVNATRPITPPPTPSPHLYTLKTLRQAGYLNSGISVRRGVVKVGGYPVLNDLFDPEYSQDALVRQVNAALIQLDTHLLSELAKSSQSSTYLNADRAMGRTGRGWGMASPYTNVWRYYVDWLRRLNQTKICEVGFHAGHSAVLYQTVLPTIEFLVEFAPSATLFGVPKVYAERRNVTVISGNSCSTIPAARMSKALIGCDLISLAGGQTVHDVLCDLFQLYPVSDPPSTIILIDNVDSRRLMDPRTSVGHHFMSGANDVLMYLVQEAGLVLLDCHHSDMEMWPKSGVCAFHYGSRFKALLPGLMVQYVPSSKPQE